MAVDTSESVREAARLVDCGISDVHSDLKHLEVLGVLDLDEEEAPGGTIKPVVPFDRIEMHIDYPLLGDGDPGDAPASA
ncbi:hypothetical protein Hbl1158_03340 [Halobaculum sp. CBA1158]|uniref:HVO_A0114 family putative DNA-binding protein n=1 Tax=Halobaculum sp. CBA1158 TaxID=2904243 RepID=UPI001F40F310|nr:hypothetical protein [Halobaculum sp. CBA1158]UIP00412.1 hypothetical protein Hbl1158_03340 [Halobaculum sp. CBA1158]